MRQHFTGLTTRHLSGMAVSAWAAVCFSAGSLAAEWRVATAYPADNYHTTNLQQFGETVAQETGGAVKLAIHPNASLYKGPDIFPAVKSGKIEGGEVILSGLGGESQLFALDSLPFVVRGFDDARLLWRLSRPAIAKRFAEHGLQLLYAVPWPPQNLYSVRPLLHGDDVKGLRMRTYNPMMERLAEIMGAKPVPLQTAELSAAIGQKKIDLMLTSSWTGVENRAWTGFGYYYSNVNAWIPKNAVFVSKKLYDALDPDMKARIDAAASQAEERGWKLAQQNSARYDQELAASGLKVQAIDHLLLRQFQRYGEKLAFEWLRNENGEGLQVLLSFQTELFNQGMAKREGK